MCKFYGTCICFAFLVLFLIVASQLEDFVVFASILTQVICHVWEIEEII